jgi:hypothetical protein
MTTLKRATIRSYDAATHRASVQPLDSLPTNITLPVATDIPAAEVVAGRECAVLLFDDNPDNGVVVTIHGAVPAFPPTIDADVNITGDLIVDGNLNAWGLDYIAGMSGQTITNAYGCRTAMFINGSGKTLTNYYGFYANIGNALFATCTNWYGFYIPQMTLGTNRLGFYEAGRSGTPLDADGNRFRSNTQFGSTTGSFGGGDGVIGIANRTTAPSSNPTGGGVLYADSGALKWRGSGGTVTTIAPA